MISWIGLAAPTSAMMVVSRLRLSLCSQRASVAGTMGCGGASQDDLSISCSLSLHPWSVPQQPLVPRQQPPPSPTLPVAPAVQSWRERLRPRLPLPQHLRRRCCHHRRRGMAPGVAGWATGSRCRSSQPPRALLPTIVASVTAMAIPSRRLSSPSWSPRRRSGMRGSSRQAPLAGWSFTRSVTSRGKTCFSEEGAPDGLWSLR
mmetsp:Transcript_61629/g.155630  ORF Transcript_61629/g.155630 Transcript_61629/m.155630 type:complete len:203 (-) Transcript_61629:906-1514(-)